MAETVTIKDVEIFQVGTHNKDPYTLTDLEGMVRSASEVGFTPPVKIGHMRDDDTAALLKAEGMPAFGWIKNIRMKGEKLVGDLCEVPRRIAELIRNGAYKRLSAEIYWNFTQNGRTWPRVLKAVSLLGSEVPAVTSLKDVEALYGAKPYTNDQPPGEVKLYYAEIMPVAPAGAQLKDRSIVGYREGDAETRCGTCRFYLGLATPGSVGNCMLVMGEIASDARCDLFEVREAFLFSDKGCTVEKRGDEFCVVQDGKVISKHASMDEAKKKIEEMDEGDKEEKDDEKYSVKDGWVEFQLDRETVAKFCPSCAEHMAKDNLKALKLYHNTKTKEYAGFNAGLCGSFGAYEGFRTRCMESVRNDDAWKDDQGDPKIDDAAPFCNALKVWCVDNGHLDAPKGGEKKHAVDPEFEGKHPRDPQGHWTDKPGGGERTGGDSDGGKSGEPSKPRSLSTIASEIRRNWKNVNYGAKPYLDAMSQLDSINDTGYSVVAYFLSNATGWKGEDAKRIKAELKTLMKGAGRKHFAFLPDVEGGEIVVELHAYKIQKRGEKWCVLTEDGSKTLGCHDSEEKAQAQLGAVEASKARAEKAHATEAAVLQADLDAESEPLTGGEVLLTLGEHQLVRSAPGVWHVATIDRTTTVGTYATEPEAQVALALAEPAALDAALTATPEQRLALTAAEERVKAWSPQATPRNTVVVLGEHQILRDGEQWYVARIDGKNTVGEYRDEQTAFVALAEVEATALGVRMSAQEGVAGQRELAQGAEIVSAEPARSAGNTTVLPEWSKEVSTMDVDVKKLSEDLAAARVRIVQLEQELQKAYQKVEANARATEENSQMHSKIAELQARVVEMETRDLDREDKIILDNLVAAGKLLPAEREIQEKLLTGARGQVQSYAENGVRRERPMRTALLEALEKRPTVMQFGEVTRGDDGLQHEDPAVEVENRVRKFRETNSAATYEQAYHAVLNANPKLKQRYAARSTQQ
jgi:hypothetical protein